MDLETQPVSLSLPNIHKEGEGDTGSMPSSRQPLANEESIAISGPSSASSSWLNLMQHKMKSNDKPQQPAPTAIISSVPMINMNEQQAMPSMISPSNQAFQSLLSSVNNMTFNPYPMYSQFNNNLPTPNTSLLNGFSFPATAYTAPATAATNQQNANMMAPKPAHAQPAVQAQNNNKNNNNNNVCVRSITVKFLTMYYNTLHSNPDNLKRFYHLNAEIDRSDFHEFQSKPMAASNNHSFRKLSALKNVLFVDLDKILHQHSINNSILIRVNGTMKFPQNIIKSFEQIFFIYKSKDGFWLIQNDIFWILDGNVDAVEKENVNDSNISQSECMDMAMHRKESHGVNENNNPNMVNKRMVNKFYHDVSYQQFDNNLAIFIRPIPNNITHSKLCGILRSNLIKQCNSNGRNIDICIDYIDVNYHKQFAFVYFGNQETLDVALEMNELHVNGQVSQIQRKRSHNGPRKFFSRKRKQTI